MKLGEKYERIYLNPQRLGHESNALTTELLVNVSLFHCIFEIQQFPLSMLILGQKPCFLGPTIFEIPRPNWYYCVTLVSMWRQAPIRFELTYSVHIDPRYTAQSIQHIHLFFYFLPFNSRQWEYIYSRWYFKLAICWRTTLVIFVVFSIIPAEFDTFLKIFFRLRQARRGASWFSGSGHT